MDVGTMTYTIYVLAKYQRMVKLETILYIEFKGKLPPHMADCTKTDIETLDNR